jgi:1-deoxy-D-xylulose-5-phosphate synthase
MPAGTGLSALEKAFPERFFDVGICEQHAVTLAAGMAASGMRPVAAIYSTFLQRGYDQVIHDVCLQNLPVLFAIDRAGLVGEDSPTHEGAFDISFLRAIPNLQILVPRDDVDLRAMLHGATHHDGPVAIRYPRDMAVRIGDECPRGNCTEPEMLRAGEDVLFLALGPVGGACLQAAGLLEKQGYSAGVADMRCAKPLDGAFLDRLPDIPIITVEENALAGGFGSAVLEHYADTHGVDRTRVLRVGFPDHYWSHATRQEQLIDLGLDAPGLARRAQSFLEMGVTNAVK